MGGRPQRPKPAVDPVAVDGLWSGPLRRYIECLESYVEDRFLGPMGTPVRSSYGESADHGPARGGEVCGYRTTFGFGRLVRRFLDSGYPKWVDVG